MHQGPQACHPWVLRQHLAHRVLQLLASEEILTPAGVPGTPGYGYAGAVVPGTPGARRASAVPFTPNAIMGHSGLSTPGYGQRQLQLQQQQQQQQAAERMKKRPAVPTFSDGTSAPLRHAPRRQKGTGEKLPAPSTPAPVPQHWSNPPPATPAPAAPEEPVPTLINGEGFIKMMWFG